MTNGPGELLRSFKAALEKRTGWTAVLFASMAGLFIWLSTYRYGIGVSPDSTIYIDCARSIARFDGMETFMGIYHRYAPLYPILLSPFELLGVGAPTGALILNLAFFILTAYLASLMIRELVPRELFIPAVLVIVLSKPLIDVSVMAWTEPLFIFLVLLSLTFLSRYMRSGEWRPLILSASAAALASLSRYIGITLILSGFLIILIHSREKGLKQRMSMGVAFASISSIPTVIFLARNYMRTSTLIGYRPPSSISFGENLHGALFSMTNWFVPSVLPSPVFLLAMLVFLVVVPVSIIVLWRNSGKDDRRRSVSVPLIYFFSIYVFYLLGSSALVGFDRINERFMSPVFVPFAIILFGALGSFTGPAKDRGREKGERLTFRHLSSSKSFLVLLGIMILIITPSFAAISMASASRMSDGAGRYSTDSWRESSFMRYLECNVPNGTVYSNDPWAVNYMAGLRDLDLSPRRTYQNSNEFTDDMDRLKVRLNEGGICYLAWFDIVDRDYLMSVEEISSQISLRSIAVFSDGQLYEMSLGEED